MRRLGWAAGGVAALGALVSLSDLLAAWPARADVVNFSILAASAWLAFLAATLLAPRGWWTWSFPAAWAGLGVAALFLAYKDTFLEELAYFGPATLGLHALLHVLTAPIVVFFGFVVGFVDPAGWKVVLACLALALLGGELLRRRLRPTLRPVAAPAPR